MSFFFAAGYLCTELCAAVLRNLLVDVNRSNQVISRCDCSSFNEFVSKLCRSSASSVEALATEWFSIHEQAIRTQNAAVRLQSQQLLHSIPSGCLERVVCAFGKAYMAALRGFVLSFVFSSGDSGPYFP